MKQCCLTSSKKFRTNHALLLQALRVVGVRVGASVWAGTDGRAGVAGSAALAVVGNTGGGRRSAGTRLGRGGAGLDSGAGLDGGGRAGAGARAAGSSVGRVDGSEADVGVDDLRAGGTGLDVTGDTRGGGAGSTGSTLRGGADGVGRVEPEHVGVVVIPQRHDEDHTLGESLTHLGESTLVLEGGLVTKGSLLSVTVGIGDGVVASDASLGRVRVGDQLAVLDVVTADLGQHAAGLDELGHDGEDLGGVDGQALAVEGGVALAVAVEVASIGVALSSVAVGAVSTSALITVAHDLADGLARVGSERSRDRVGLPDVLDFDHVSFGPKTM